jgi:O-antigen/teichoic acid export membrane protein
MLVVSAVAAAVGVVIARKFGRSDETDGLLAAYGVFIVIAIAAQAIRVAVLPELALARQANRLAGEVAGYVIALLVVAVPLVLVAELGARGFAWVLTGAGPDVARHTAAAALRWMVPAAVAYLFAGIAASALAALDDYAVAALGYAAGSLSGLTLILVRADTDGIIAVAWAMALNASIALAVPVLALALRAVRAAMPRAAMRSGGRRLRERIHAAAVSAALPLGLQLLYVVCLPFAARVGTGGPTTFVYGYLAAASLVTVAGASLGLATSVPLTRRGLDPRAAARHVVATSWLALTLIGAAAGIFALAGGDVVESVLGRSYAGDIGADLGRLVVVLSPWMIASVGVSVTFPLAFVVGRTKRLPWVALGAIVLQVPLAWAGETLLELEGLAVSLAVTTFLVLGALLLDLSALRWAAQGLAIAAGLVCAVAVPAYAIPGSLLSPPVAATLGTLAYVTAIALVRPRGLRESWQYMRHL